jgi:hypothetical protein
MSGTRYADMQERIIANSILSDETHHDGTPCWIWIGTFNREGYPNLSVRTDKPWPSKPLAHRMSYEAFVGPIPIGLVLMHRCNVKQCVAPLHLKPGTQSENMQQCVADGRWGNFGKCESAGLV